MSYKNNNSSKYLFSVLDRTLSGEKKPTAVKQAFSNDPYIIRSDKIRKNLQNISIKGQHTPQIFLTNRFTEGLVWIPNSEFLGTSDAATNPLTVESRLDYMNTILNFDPTAKFLFYSRGWYTNSWTPTVVADAIAMLDSASVMGTKIIFACTKSSKVVFDDKSNVVDLVSEAPASRSAKWFACNEMTKSAVGATPVQHKWDVSNQYFHVSQSTAYSQSSEVWIFPPTSSNVTSDNDRTFIINTRLDPFKYYRVQYEIYKHTGSVSHITNSWYPVMRRYYPTKHQDGTNITDPGVNVEVAPGYGEFKVTDDDMHGPQWSNAIEGFMEGQYAQHKWFTGNEKLNYSYWGVVSGNISGWRICQDLPNYAYTSGFILYRYHYSKSADVGGSAFVGSADSSPSGAVHISGFKIFENPYMDDFRDGGVNRSKLVSSWSRVGSLDLTTGASAAYSASLSSRNLWLQTFRTINFRTNHYENGIVSASKNIMDFVYNLFGTHSAFGGIWGDEDEYIANDGWAPYTQSYSGIALGKYFHTMSEYWASKSSTSYYLFGDGICELHNGNKFNFSTNQGVWTDSTTGGHLSASEYLNANNLILANWFWRMDNSSTLGLVNSKSDWYDNHISKWLMSEDYSAYNYSNGSDVLNDYLASSGSRIINSKATGYHIWSYDSWNTNTTQSRMIPYRSGINPQYTAALLATSSGDPQNIRIWVNTLNAVKFFGDQKNPPVII